MKKFKVHLTRDYTVEINAENENSARQFTELYVSGGADESREKTRLLNKFQIEKIEPTLNEAWFVEELSRE
jgi:hypothetical protein